MSPVWTIRPIPLIHSHRNLAQWEDTPSGLLKPPQTSACCQRNEKEIPSTRRESNKFPTVCPNGFVFFDVPGPGCLAMGYASGVCFAQCEE